MPPPPPRRLIMLVSIVFIAVGCAPGAVDEEGPDAGGLSGLVPSFPPLEADETPAPAPTADAAPEPTPAPEPADPTPAPAEAQDEPEAVPTTTAQITDPRGDVEWTLERPPDYVDIVAAELVRSPEGFELRIRFAADLPERQEEEDRTMNVASFYDVTGDGRIDYEIWVNLADQGWGPGYLDRREEEAGFMHESGVEVWVEGPELVHRFPVGHLDDAGSFRWAVASEWGPYEALGTPATARDHAPDDGAAPFPS